MKRTLVLPLVLAALLGTIGSAHAAPTQAEKDLEQARAEFAQGHLVEAEDLLARITNDPARPGDPPALVKARKSAESLRAEVMVKTPLLSVTLENQKPGEDVTVTVDGKPLDAPSESHRQNPGPHVIVARSGSRSVTEKVVIAESEGKSVKLDFSKAVEDPPQPPQAEAHGDVAPPSAAVKVSTSDGGSALPKVLLYGGIGLAVAGVGLGTGTGLVSLSHTDSAKKLCSGQSCPATAHDELSTARTTATVSTVSFVAAGVGAGALAAGFILMRRESEPPKTAFVRPYVSPFGAGLSGAF